MTTPARSSRRPACSATSGCSCPTRSTTSTATTSSAAPIACRASTTARWSRSRWSPGTTASRSRRPSTRSSRPSTRRTSTSSAAWPGSSAWPSASTATTRRGSSDVWVDDDGDRLVVSAAPAPGGGHQPRALRGGIAQGPARSGARRAGRRCGGGHPDLTYRDGRAIEASEYVRGVATRVLVIDNYDSFVYNLVQYLGELGAEPLVHRHDDLTLDEIRGAGARRRPDLTRSGHPGRRGRVERGHRGLRRRGAGARGVPRPPVHRPGVRRSGGAGPAGDARQDLAHPPRRRGRVRRAARPARGHPLPQPRGRPGVRPRLPGDHRRDRRRDRHGAAPPRARRRRRAVPPRVDPDRRRPRPAAQLPRAGGRARCTGA